LDKVDELGDGLAQIAIVEEAVALADAHRDDDLAFEARQALVRAATFGGRPDLGIVAYSWMLAKSDEDPKRFHDPQLLWRYKWIVDKAVHGNSSPNSGQQLSEPETF